MKAWKELPYGAKVAIAFVLFFASTLFFGYFRAKDTRPKIGIEHIESNPAIVELWKGRPKVIYFWATWCSICKVYGPILEANLKLLPSDYLFISVREADDGESLGKSPDAEKPVYIADYTLLKDWEVNAYPTTVFTDAEDHIVFADTGIISPIGFFLRSFITKFF